jgi:hypothetical protein
MAFVNALSLEGAIVEWNVSGLVDAWTSIDTPLPEGLGTLTRDGDTLRLLNAAQTVNVFAAVRVRVPGLLSAVAARVTVIAANMDADSGGQDAISATLFSTGQTEPDISSQMANHLQGVPLVLEDVDPNPVEFEAFEVTGEEGGSVGISISGTNS